MTRLIGKLVPKDNGHVKIPATFYTNGLDGGGETSDYSELENKPTINGVELDGNLTNEDLHIGSVEIEYQDLVALRDNGELVPGTQYKITNYQCTTTQINTQSANHAFDIIVVADDVDKLNENARAVKHLSPYYGVDKYLWRKFEEGEETDYYILTDEMYTEGSLSLDNPVSPYAFIEIENGEVTYNANRPNDLLVECSMVDDELRLYKTNIEDYGDEVDYLDYYIYISTFDYVDYFENCKLEAWELKYCLDNDTNRFAWADEENGTGVIYYMKDEWNNECPYDFKNIMFKRWAVTEFNGCPSLVVDSEDNVYGYYFGAKDLSGMISALGNDVTYGEDFGWFYTFALKDLATENWYDYTVVANLGLKDDDGLEVACYDNHLAPGTDKYFSGKGDMAKMLNNIVFFNRYTDLSDTSYADDYSYCNNNCFQGNCFSNTFGNNCYYNSFGNYCYNNTFGNSCHRNTFGNNFQFNTFGNDCYDNTFVNDCYDNTFGNDCSGNIFGNNFKFNTFGYGCNYNTFGNLCLDNTFGNNCHRNSFGNYCYNNTFGNNYRYNTFGNECYGNMFGNYCQNITVFDGVQNCSVTGGSNNSYVKNAQILNGTAGPNTSNRLTIGFVANKSYTQVAAKDTNGDLKIWTPADLVP